MVEPDRPATAAAQPSGVESAVRSGDHPPEAGLAIRVARLPKGWILSLDQGWRRGQSRANRSLRPHSLLNRERTGNFGELPVNRWHVSSNPRLFSIGYESNS